MKKKSFSAETKIGFSLQRPNVQLQPYSTTVYFHQLLGVAFMRHHFIGLVRTPCLANNVTMTVITGKQENKGRAAVKTHI